MTNQTDNGMLHNIGDIEIHLRMFSGNILDPPIDVLMELQRVYDQLKQA
jgi:hypothetical protein